MKQAAFITLVTFQKIAQNPYNTMEQRMHNVPLCTMYNRWDGKIGFIGGLVDDGEDTLSAAIREFEEESGISINHLKDKAINVYEETLNTTHSTLYYVVLNPKEFHDIISQMTLSQSFNSEGSPMVVHLVDHNRNGKTLGFSQYLLHNFAPMAKNGLLSIKDMVDNYQPKSEIYIKDNLFDTVNVKPIKEYIDILSEECIINVISDKNVKERNQALTEYWKQGINVDNLIHTDGIKTEEYLKLANKNSIIIDDNETLALSLTIMKNVS